ncbi:PIN domain-like protein [Acaromyces ingoldii]|uniref:PIN domain-like protein n=1 Tax=Acaromyces ingoldii TaxID=215250 RepID=A0A316YS68_9BASI|nr:PIN domain-like protein [Acaromyces ingoldii]PWN90585.1 PIN domain-like protein [Acaromyces ingoldii]
MGVQGLWHLIQPCARPTKLESLEGKRLAIDSSIWLYHFQMAMRDKEGRTLSNAHILGFLWRILKLIHYGIRPIFVFDGGAPVMKRQTLVNRRTRRQGAKDDHRKIAERLLNARMREAAVVHVSGGGGAKGKERRTGSGVDEGATESQGGHGLGADTVYFDDLAAQTGAAPSDGRGQTDADQGRGRGDGDDENGLDEPRDSPATEAAKSRNKRNDFHKDPYALPALEQDISSLTADSSNASTRGKGRNRRQDIRFATEGELRALLSSIGPTDLDMDSEFFRSLPPELQYELVGDLRAASRGTSYKRLQTMLAQSPTPIDFSKAQIAGLKTRNELTQKVLEVTDEIGDAHIKVPIRVAGARNKEYVLVKNKGKEGGFSLGVVDQGASKEKAIVVDEDDTASFKSSTDDEGATAKLTDSDADMEDVPIDVSIAVPSVAADPVPASTAAALAQANPNDPAARKEVARELLQRRAQELAREKRREQGVEDEREKMEDQLRKSREAAARDLFRPENIDMDADDESEDEASEDWQEIYDGHRSRQDKMLEEDEAQDLAMALRESVASTKTREEEVVTVSETSLEGGTDEEDMDEVPTHAFEAHDYSSFYASVPETSNSRTVTAEHDRVAGVRGQAWPTLAKGNGARDGPRNGDHLSLNSSRGPALSFRLSDRPGYPERLNSKLLVKRRWDEEADEEEDEEEQASQPQQMVSLSRKDSGAGYATKEVATPVDLSESADEAVATVPQLSTSSVTVSAQRDAGEEADGPSAAATEQSPEIEVNVVDFAMPSSRRLSIARRSKAKAVDNRDDARVPELDNSHSSGVSVEPVQKTDEDSEPAMPTEVEKNGRDRQEDVEKAPSVVKGDSSGLVVDLPHSHGTKEEPEEEPQFDNLPAMMDEVVDERPLPSLNTAVEEEDDDEGTPIEWSPSPSPGEPRAPMLGADGFPLPSAEELEALEADDEAELGQMQGDQDEFVSFLSRAKGQGLHQIQQEVQEEVDKLRSEHATTRRTEGDVTQQMAREIQLMLRLFGLPYITAPMEAEAQCAELVALRLADGVITDDSDVFLFGGTFVYKNMFNNKKYVECFKLSDLQHDLGMDRTKLVQLAYLLGSDYTEGLAGVGPVLAMEILSIFKGDDALVNFRQWWLKVQQGKDSHVDDTRGLTMRRIKKSLRNKVTLDANWPDPKVLDAYYEPQVDVSREAFQWGLPDLDSLRSFFLEYLRWPSDRTDHYLLPAIEAQNRRSRARGNQSTLDRGNFFDLTAGAGVYAGRQRPTYGSERTGAAKPRQTPQRQRRAEVGNVDGLEEPHEPQEGEDQFGEKALKEDAEQWAGGDVPEELLGKEMGKRSRPIVRRGEGGGEREGTERGKDVEEFEGERGEKTDTGKGHDKGGRGMAAKKAKRKTSSKEDVAPKKRTRRPKNPIARGGTSIRTGRNMSLDDVASLPPSRGQSITAGLVPQRASAARARQLINIEPISDNNEDGFSSSAEEYR